MSESSPSPLKNAAFRASWQECQPHYEAHFGQAFDQLGSALEALESNDRGPQLRLGALLSQTLRGHLGQERSESKIEAIALGPHIFMPRRLQFWPEGRSEASVKLTDRERDILVVLALSPTGSCQRDELLQAVWGFRSDLDTHTLETHIYRLRQKIDNNKDRPEIIVTQENGYALTLPINIQTTPINT